MAKAKRIFFLELHQETDTFNPIRYDLEMFSSIRHAEGEDFFKKCRNVPGQVAGALKAVEEAGGVAIPSMSLYGVSGGCISDSSLDYFLEKVKGYLVDAGHIDGILASLHGATVSETHEDVCGDILEFVRSVVGPDLPIASCFDLHANITDKIIANSDFVTGYQTYPHIDLFQTGYRAGKQLMDSLNGVEQHIATAKVPMLVPPAGYSTKEEPLKTLFDYADGLVKSGKLIDYTIFIVQPWLDISEITSRVVCVADTIEDAELYSEKMAVMLYERRTGCWPDLEPVEDILRIACNGDTPKPVILADAADSPNGGCVGDSVAVAMVIYKKGLNINSCMFVKDPEAAKKAFAVGVGNEAEFEIGAKYTKNMPGPLKAKARVRSLHDGIFYSGKYENKGMPNYIGKSAVVSITTGSYGRMDILLCDTPGATGDPQIFKHFGLEPEMYDLVVVKANTSFKKPYGEFAGSIHYGNTPGAGSSDLLRFEWKKVPKDMYPFVK